MNATLTIQDAPLRFRGVPRALTAVFLMILISTVCLAEDLRQQQSSDKPKPESAARKEAAQIWETIRTAGPKDPKKYKDGQLEYWVEIYDVGFRELKKIIKSPNPREALEYYVNQFGKHGPQADMRWLMPVRSWNLAADWSPAGPYRDKKYRDFRRIQILFAELQVRQFLKSPDLLDRYYQSIVWYGGFFKELNFPVYLGGVYRHMQKDEDDEYWWFAQNFLLMAHATGRDDLLKNVKPENLKPRCTKWFEWLKNNGMYLRPSAKAPYWVLDEGERSRQEGYVPFVLQQELPPLKVRPKYPFPDWKGPSPATPRDFKAIE
jgi:hypothetical protein